MKAGLLAAGLGTRFAQGTMAKPKRMIEIGAVPIMARAHVKSAAGAGRAKLDPSG